MHCREFRNKHVAFVDDMLPAVEMDAMRRHVMRCASCARQDTRVRRGLLLVRNLPPIEASPDFTLRLNERLARIGPVSRTDYVNTRAQYASTVTAVAFVAGLAAVAYLAIETNRYFVPADTVRVAPEVAAVFPEPPAVAPASMANAALASVPTGIPVWPAVLMVGQSPMRFASMETRDSDLGR